MKKTFTQLKAVKQYQKGNPDDNKEYPSLEIVRLEKIFFKSKPGKILDYAIGGGCNAFHFIKKKYDLVGIDTNPSLRKLLNKVAKEKKLKMPKFKVLKPDSVKLPFEDNCFDYIYALSVLSLLGENIKIINLLSEFKRILKQKGKIIIDINDQNSLNDYRNKVDEYARENILNTTAYTASMKRFEDEIAEQKRERNDKLVLDFTKNISKYVSQNEVPYRIAELVDKTDDPNVQSVAMNYLNTYNTYVNKQLTEATNTADAKKAKLLSDRQNLIENDKGFHEKIKSNLEVLASQNYNNRAILPEGIKTSADLYNKNYHNKYSGDKDSTIDDYNIQENYKDMTKFLVDYFRSTKTGTSLDKDVQQQIENSQISIIQNPNHRLHRVTVNDLIKTLKKNAASRLEGKEDDDGRIAEYNIIMNLSEDLI